jgi:copper homeostasis protein
METIPPAIVALEVIATSVADGVAATRGGADRLEVVASMQDDGLLPDLDLVYRLRDAVTVPLRVMLRERAGFAIDARGLFTLCRAAERLRAAGIDQFVFGFLTAEGHLDLEAILILQAAVAPGAWTLHRAFDHTPDATLAFAQCAGLPGLDLILSAGSRDGVDAGLANLRCRAGWQTSRLRWLAGGGLRLEHILPLRAAGITQFHCGRAARRGRDWGAPVEEALVRQLKEGIVGVGREP